MKKNKKIIYITIIVFILLIVSIRTDFFQKSFFWNTFSQETPLPSSYDLRNVDGYNYTSPTKNQSWAACWDFASVATLESNVLMHNQLESYYLDNNNDGEYEDSSHVLDFSERQIDYFIASGEYYDEEYNPFTVANHLIGRGGTIAWTEVAYATGLAPIVQSKWAYPTGEVQVNNSNVFDSENVDYFVTETIRFPNISENSSQEVKDERTRIIKEHIMQYGGIAFAGPRGNISTNCYDSDVDLYTYSPDCDIVGGHAMSIIGWNDHLGPNDVGAWLIRDSARGEEGANNKYSFFYMAYNYNSISDLFLVKKVKNKDWDNDYNLTKKYDYNMKNNSGIKTYTMKYYKKQNNDEKLRYINFDVETPNTSFDVYVSPSGNEDDYIKIDTVTKDYPGLLTIEVDDNIILDSSSFVIKVITSASIYMPSYGSPKPVMRIQAFTDDISDSNERSISVTYDLDDPVLSSVNSLKINVFTENININEKPSLIGVFNSNNENVTELFNIRNNIYYNDYGYMLIGNTQNIPLDTYTIRVGYDDLYDEIDVNLSSIDHTVFDSGIGTEENPYVITTLEQLNMINTQKYYLQAHYILNADIDMSECQTPNSICYNNGKGWRPIGNSTTRFTGKFNGNNHKIINMYINRLENDIGFFGVTKDSEIKNLIFVDGNVIALGYVGMLVGEMTNTNISNIKTNGQVTGTGYTGGVVGYNVNMAYINGIFNNANVTSSQYTGGIIGYQTNNVNIANSFNTGRIEGETSGGLLGYASVFNNITITNSYNAGNIVASNNAGGIIGYSEKSGTTFNFEGIYNVGKIENATNIGQIIGGTNNNHTSNFSEIYILDNNVSAINNNLEDNITVLSKNNFIIKNSFTNFDFENVWEIKNTNAYPTLKSNPYTYITDIQLSSETIEIEIGNTHQLEYTILPNNASNMNLYYTITNNGTEEDVVSISNDGLISALEIGEATISLIPIDNSYPIKNINVRVVIPVESIELYDEELELYVDEENVLEYRINPSNATNKNVTFTSSDPSIVTVDSEGNVIGVGPGTATITVTTEDGAKSDSLIITVKKMTELSSDTYEVKDEEKIIVIPDLITEEVFNNNVYSSYRLLYENTNSYIGTGTNIIINNNNSIINTYQVIVYGDVNGDGRIELEDIVKIANHIYNKQEPLNGIYLKAADYDKDNEYTLSDIMKTAKKYSAKE